MGRYGLAEIAENLPQLGETAAYEWAQLRTQIQVVRDISSFRWPVVFEPAKDRPVLFTAAAWADVLLTLDRADFGGLMSGGFYGFSVLKPGDFLRNERAAGRVRTS